MTPDEVDNYAKTAAQIAALAARSEVYKRAAGEAVSLDTSEHCAKRLKELELEIQMLEAKGHTLQ